MKKQCETTKPVLGIKTSPLLIQLNKEKGSIMNKFIAILLVLVMGASLTACGQSEKDKQKEAQDKMFGQLTSNSIK